MPESGKTVITLKRARHAGDSCLRCGVSFIPDSRYNWICPKCTKRNKDVLYLEPVRPGFTERD